MVYKLLINIDNIIFYTQINYSYKSVLDSAYM